jgi:hypothetical protein
MTDVTGAADISAAPIVNETQLVRMFEPPTLPPAPDRAG